MNRLKYFSFLFTCIIFNSVAQQPNLTAAAKVSALYNETFGPGINNETTIQYGCSIKEAQSLILEYEKFKQAWRAGVLIGIPITLGTLPNASLQKILLLGLSTGIISEVFLLIVEKYYENKVAHLLKEYGEDLYNINASIIMDRLLSAITHIKDEHNKKSFYNRIDEVYYYMFDRMHRFGFDYADLDE